ncbi:hypothetical protein [Arthrobacter sp. YN]|uniref:hypothetical protein n=1 Tax=Arthrobacter sp. YN TaxID=2020486 RepID=UPI000B5DBA86|nr:hypothetical protein [Arthrobacter sp. YN]ASN20122.1 hypothetical protein CGK93_10920 [Arthrobacter sp. YN]
MTLTTTVTLEIPDGILEGIESGDLFRWGGVIRDAGGQFVTFLSDVTAAGSDMPASPSVVEKLVDRASEALKSGNKGSWIIAGTAAVAAVTVGAVLFVAVRNRASKASVPDLVSNYNAALVEYLKAARAGELNAETVGQLISDLDAMVGHVDAEGRSIKVDFNSKKSKALHSLVLAFTGQLARAHGLDAQLILDFEKTQLYTSGNESVDELRRHLVAQQRILREAS